MYHSDNDPYVPFSFGQEVAENVGIDVHLIKGAGHFNEKASYFRFEQLLKNIKELL